MCASFLTLFPKSTGARRPTVISGPSRIRYHYVLIVVFMLSGCSPKIAPFSHIAYEQSVDLKVDSLKLMDQAELPYSETEKALAKLQIRLEKAFEFAKGRPKNQHSANQWQILISPESNLLGGFLQRWQNEGALNRPFIVASKQLVSAAFDSIIELESGKSGGTSPE